MMQLLLDKSTSELGHMVIQAAAKRGHVEAVRLLLKRSIAAIENIHLDNVLVEATKLGHEAIVQLLLNNSTSIGRAKDEDRFTAL